MDSKTSSKFVRSNQYKGIVFMMIGLRWAIKEYKAAVLLCGLGMRFGALLS